MSYHFSIVLCWQVKEIPGYQLPVGNPVKTIEPLFGTKIFPHICYPRHFLFLEARSFFELCYKKKLFASSFDLLHELETIFFQGYSSKELSEEMAKIQSVLSDDKDDWEHRLAAVHIAFCKLSLVGRFSMMCHQSKTTVITTANKKPCNNYSSKF